MKRILITGANSYIGTQVEKLLLREPDKYLVNTLDMKDSKWKDFEFSNYEIVLHVAGIAHVSTKRKMKDLYFKINRDLAIETAFKAKSSGVRLFIFMSSMIVYSSKESRITLETKPNPDNFYGMSKIEAEDGIQALTNENFNVCILRPPFIYGNGSLGNFKLLIKYSKYICLLPKIFNKRSLLFIDNLCAFIKKIIDFNYFGVYYPRNKEILSTNYLIRSIRKEMGKKTYESIFLRPIAQILIYLSRYLKKIYSSRYYDIIDDFEFGESKFEDSLKETLRGE